VTEESFEARVVRLFEAIHPLDRVDRAGYVMRGVPEPESVAAHCHFVALLTLLVVDQYPDEFDRQRALTIALTHDLCEARLMDIPMPVADRHFREAKDAAEQAITEELFAGFPPQYARWHQEFLDASTPEAKLVRGLDKVQMMIKVIMYEREHRGRLEEFWANPRNFSDYGIEAVSKLFDALCAEAGRERPR
jgi:putative hydrolases of HD superfamily